jgi:hypothetical protein
MCYNEFIEGKLGICLLLVMSIDDDWMVDLMIIYIEKIIAKALDINNIFKKTYGDINSESPNLLINNQIRPPIEILKVVYTLDIFI